MLPILIFKWLFIFSTIALSVYHYRLERQKLNTISKYISDPKVLSGLKSSARQRMSHFFLLFAGMIVWIMSYDLEIQHVNKQKQELTLELEKASKIYGNTDESQKRLIEANADQNVIDDIKTYYTDVFVNYYVMRKCSLANNDDIFIINSAMAREMGLNKIDLTVRDEILKNAKSTYLKRFADIDCSQVTTKNSDITINYRNYIETVREVLKATF